MSLPLIKSEHPSVSGGGSATGVGLGLGLGLIGGIGGVGSGSSFSPTKFEKCDAGKSDGEDDGDVEGEGGDIDIVGMDESSSGQRRFAVCLYISRAFLIILISGFVCSADLWVFIRRKPVENESSVSSKSASVGFGQRR